MAARSRPRRAPTTTLRGMFSRKGQSGTRGGAEQQSMPESQRHLSSVHDDRVAEPRDPDVLLARVARGDRAAYEALYDQMVPQVYGVIRRVLRDPSQSEEVAQDVMVEVWRTATRFDTDRGSAKSLILTMAHRRAVDRVRSVQSSRDREERVSRESRERPFDSVADAVETRFETQQVREALKNLTDVQREAIEMAYYGGNTYREVAALLDTPLGTVKTRMRDGLIRLRDAMEVETR